MKKFYFKSNGDIVVHAVLNGASGGTAPQPASFELIGLECGSLHQTDVPPSFKDAHRFPSFWWNEAKACGGYFHLTSEQDLLEDLYPHDEDATKMFFTEMELGRMHFPAFLVRLPSFGESAKERLWDWETIRRYEYKTGTNTVWGDGETTSDTGQK